MTASAADVSAVDDGVYRTTFDPSVRDPCLAVVEAIEAATDGELPVLAESIDPDTLVRLFESTASESWMMNFQHGTVEVTVWGTGRIHVDTGSVGDAPGTVDDASASSGAGPTS
ncbi:HalOD1 output domain-containing protein [Halohasta salina]|uniref:HalOD1 output domain-containing protein n=1 Tax=Halohasta salina TaxID=2961621 RepID=UPI0020A35646|nr:HalOD1 output domain-containing protein [Halohasta salina]